MSRQFSIHRTSLLAFACTTMLLFSTGCRIDTHKNGNGNDNVDIGTPFGSMHVKTDDKPDSAKTGMTPYPGATLLKKEGDNSSSADISMNFGGFQLGVHNIDLQTPDPEDKVVAFYKKDMTRYGAVLACRGREAVGTPVRTGEGLTCGSDQKEFSTSNSDHLELRAGSEKHQHIVTVRPDGTGTRIGLVALDLPSGFSHHDASDRE